MANNSPDDNPRPDYSTEPELYQHFPCAGYWFEMLSTHPLDHHYHLNNVRNTYQLPITLPTFHTAPGPFPALVAPTLSNPHGPPSSGSESRCNVAPLPQGMYNFRQSACFLMYHCQRRPNLPSRSPSILGLLVALSLEIFSTCQPTSYLKTFSHMSVQTWILTC